MAGKHSPFGFPSGISISWWYSEDTFRALETLASLLIETDRTFKDCDSESATEMISTTLQQLCLDAALFNGDDVFQRRKPNLFECRASITVVEFAKRILGEIKSNLQNIIGKRCTIYPLSRFRGPSFTIPNAGLRAISEADEMAWAEFVKEGYLQRASCPKDFQQRLDKASYFVNRGMNADDIEAYVNYFVALDALFGERGAVEASIICGIQSLALGTELEERVPWLFDLRNELVHGGSRYITEWPKYGRYLKHFETNPLSDVGRLARTAILVAPTKIQS
jgi:hypothetical protein